MTRVPDSPPTGASRQLIEEALQNCAREPIHLIGKIQPVGVLIAIDPVQLTIRVASANLADVFPLAASAALGRPLAALVGEKQARQLAGLIEIGHLPGAIIWSLMIERSGRVEHYDAQVFAAGELVVIEVENEPRRVGDVFHDLFIPIRDALWKLDAESDTARYAQAVVDQVRVLTGFDRVMIYRFDHNWDGEVIAESKTDAAGSYLGNHFPASDIPPQARELYTKNLVRLITDVEAGSVPLLRAGDAHPGPGVDLTHSWLRSLSPVHVEYLRNMGVCASLSISLVQNERLWGLIACHHFSPKYVSLRERELDELIGRTVSLKLMNMENDERNALNNGIRDLLYELTDLIRCSDRVDAVVHVLSDKLLSLVRASGVVVSIGGVRHALGEVPADALQERLLAVLRRYTAVPVFHTDHTGELLGDYDGLAQYERELAGGMMVAPLDQRMDNYVMWFRPGLQRTMRWAGKPVKTVISDGGGVRISPRTSFETWIETHRGKSVPWSSAEIDAANALSMALIEALSEKALRTSEEQYRLLAENSTDMIASLDLDGRFLFVSPACRELLGQESADLAGRYLCEALGGERERVARLLQDLAPFGATQTAVLSGRRPDGRSLWIEAMFKHTLGSSDSGEIILNARDVTERYNYQLAIEEVHRRNSRILDAAGEGLVSLDLLGNVVYTNELAQRVLGADNAGLLGNHCCTVLCSADGAHCCHQDQDRCPFLTTLQDGETRQGRHLLRNAREQRTVAVDYVCTPLLENDRVVGCVVVFSESKTLVEGQDVATAVILEQAVEAVMVTDPDGRITSVNRAFTEITGYAAEDAVGKSPRILKSGVHTPHFYEEFWRRLAEQGRWTGEIWNRRKNGEVYPQWGSVTAIRDADGTVTNYVTVFSDVSKAKQAEEKLFYLANHDTLTGLPNRMRFSEQLVKTLERCRRNKCGVAVAFIDLDNFKIINDTLGHAIGDSYLKTVSDRLLAATRKQDTLARWGGDEFVLAMEGVAGRDVVRDSIERLLRQIAKPVQLAGHELIPTASIGVALFPDDGDLPVDLIKAADSAMYLAKKCGRNRFEFYAESMSEDLSRKLTMSGEMRRALDERQFFLVYQPQQDPVGGAIKGAEALIRWQHPSRGLLLPADFLPLADELGLLEEIGNWVLVQACRQMRIWREQGLPLPRVAVNVAPCQLKESFLATVGKALADAGLPPQCLEIEITEGTLESGATARRIATGLRELGVFLAVDDFGTGYSSLSHLKMFPITCFKIDKSFIDGIPGNDADVAIVRTILALGASLKVDVVAEGVETDAQASFLRAAGVGTIQGYYFARPMAPEQLFDWVGAALTGR